MKRKKILILTANFGAGHNSASKAIKKYIEEASNRYEIVIKDFVDASVPKLNKTMVKCYEYQTKYFPIVYNTYYYTKKVLDSKYDTSYKIYLDKLKKYLIRENPDLVVSVFPHASASVSYIKEHSYFDKPLITVITDVVVSNEWIHENTNMYFVPSQFVKNKLIKKNIPENIIKVTGVPVDKEFLTYNKKKIPEKKKILFMGGGRGLFDVPESFFYWLDKFIEEHRSKLEVTIVAGTNKKLYNKFTKEKPLKNIEVLGFVDNMSSLLKEQDTLITKAGGATLFEAISTGVPVIVKKPNIGQEIANAKFINRESIGFVYSKERELKRIIKELVEGKNIKDLDFMLDNINQFKKEIAPTEIFKYIEEALDIRDNKEDILLRAE